MLIPFYHTMHMDKLTCIYIHVFLCVQLFICLLIRAFQEFHTRRMLVSSNCDQCSSPIVSDCQQQLFADTVACCGPAAMDVCPSMPTSCLSRSASSCSAAVAIAGHDQLTATSRASLTTATSCMVAVDTSGLDPLMWKSFNLSPSSYVEGIAVSSNAAAPELLTILPEGPAQNKQRNT